MRDVVKSAFLWTLLIIGMSGAGFAQGPGAPQGQKRTDEVKPQLGPGTAQTKEEAESAAKAPAGVAPVITAAPVDPKTYVIGPEDILFIRVWHEPELSGGVQVRPDGKFTLPLVGEVQAEGLTPEQVTAHLSEALGNFINKPEVVVSCNRSAARSTSLPERSTAVESFHSWCRSRCSKLSPAPAASGTMPIRKKLLLCAAKSG
jgi:Periplasmic protein involved in polysaccharide export